ncbi:MAG: hypothetical protein U9Q92_07130 [archaeon]|nr:hypothetical protein [archaeon]
MLFVLALFVIYNRAKLYSVDAYGVRMRYLVLLSIMFQFIYVLFQR